MNPKSKTNKSTPQPTISPSPIQKSSKRDPGLIFGILCLISIPTGWFFIGVIFGFIGRRKSKQAGYSGTLSNISFITSGILTILFLLAVALYPIGAFIEPLFKSPPTGLEKKCQELGHGTHTVRGVTYFCG